LGDRVLYSVKNILSSNDFRANSRFNDGVENYTLSSNEAKSMIKLTQCLGLDFVGLDLIKANDGFYFIEANPKPGIRSDNEEIKDFGLDVYKEIGRFLVEQLIQAEDAK
jgi:ribosomal protein S6--L-glutamate ligase